MLVQQLDMLGNIAVVEIRDPNIEQDIKEIRKVENGEIKAVICNANCIVHDTVDPENPEWLDQEIQQEQNGKIDQEFFLHPRFVKKI
jgi:hypothetical protein